MPSMMTPGEVAYVAYMKALSGGLGRWKNESPNRQSAWEAVAEAVLQSDKKGTD